MRVSQVPGLALNWGQGWDSEILCFLCPPLTPQSCPQKSDRSSSALGFPIPVWESYHCHSPHHLPPGSPIFMKMLGSGSGEQILFLLFFFFLRPGPQLLASSNETLSFILCLT